MSENSIPEGFKMTEFGHLPKVWEVVRFGDKGQFQYGYTTSATDENTGTKFLRITDIKEDGTVNWGTVPYGSIDDNNLQKFRLSKSDILFARIGATTGKTCIIGGAIPNAVFASYLIRFVPDKELHPKYVFYFTQTREYQELVNAGKEGKLKKGLSATELKNFKIPLPPLPEQRAIAKVLSTVQGAKEKTETVIEATKELKKSLMKHLFTYGPVPVKKFNEFGEFNELRVNEFGEFNELGVDELQNAQNSSNSSNSSNSKNSINLKETEIGRVPEEWEVTKLGCVVKLNGGYSFSSYDFVKKSNTQLIRMGNLYQNKLDLNRKPVFLPDSFSNKYRKYLLNPGDLIISLTGTMGKKDYGFTVKIPHIPNKKLLLNQRVAKILITNENRFERDFFYYLFLSREFLDHLYKTAKGTKQANLSSKSVLNLTIGIPPLPIQQKIASILSAVDKKIEAEEAKKKSLDVLFKSLLQNLMTGKLRVNHVEVMI